jgi:two-component system, cell cycle sensor histidine kinase and response regulator CckA
MATASFLSEELGPSHPVAGDVAEIEGATQRAAALTRQLLAFSRKQPQSPRPVSLRTIVEDLQKMLRRIVGEDIQLDTRLVSPGRVHADVGQIEQVIVNLVVNARDAMPSGGLLSIETSTSTVNEAEAARIGVRPGRYVVLGVADTGCGMDAPTLARIFEPFFTTKPVGKGTGLGLATVFGIVKQNNGGLAVQSQVGHGSTFHVYLPLLDTDQATAVVIPELDARHGSESILVVEDDPQLRSVIQRRLLSLGYRITVAHDARSAVRVLGDARVDLLLTDLVMPGMDGRALASRALTSHPSLKVVFMSGYTEHAAVKTAALGPEEHFIAKPFTGAELSVAIRRALEDEPPVRS